MLTNYFKIAFRRILRNRVFSLINVFGLAAGLATFLLITLYILDETSYDQHHQDGDRIFRIVSSVDSTEASWAALGAPFAGGLKTDLVEVEEATRLLKLPGLDHMELRYEEGNTIHQHYETNGYFIDSTFFEVFTYEFIEGDRSTALSRPNSIVISDELALKYFANGEVIDKVVKVDMPFGEKEYIVTGVFRSGHKSHIPARFFLSMENDQIGPWVKSLTNWATNNIFHTYVKFHEDADLAGLEQKLALFMDRRGGADLKAAGFSRQLYIQPMPEIYLHSNLGFEIAATGSMRLLFILGSIAVFILFTACINFMNLSTARSEDRSREVGVRKIIGAERSNLVGQFLGESVLLSLVALVLGIGLTYLFLPTFNNITEKQLVLNGELKFFIIMVVGSLITGLLSGIYPALYLSSFKPLSVLKGKKIHRSSASLIRKGLVTFQFSVSICLIFGTLVFWNQLRFLQEQDLGFKKGQQIVLQLNNRSAVNFSVLKNELLQYPEVRTVTCGSSYPGIENIEEMLFYAEGKSINDIVDITLATIGDDYFETFDFELLAGRGFSDEFTADSLNMVLNEVAVRELGYTVEDAIGRRVNYEWRGQQHTLQIVGVVKDFHFESLHHEITPFGFVASVFGNKYQYLIADLAGEDYSQLLGDMKNTWHRVNPQTPFVYSFVDQDFQRNYEKDQRTSNVVWYFTLIAILIASLGLFGLSTFPLSVGLRKLGFEKY